MRRTLDRAIDAVAGVRRSPVRRRAARHRLMAWSLAVVIGLFVHRSLDGARAERDAWGPARPVVVAVERVEAGDAFGTSVTARRLPRVAVPDGAIGTIPAGRRAARPVGRGEVLTADDLAAPDRGPVAARLPAGTAGVRVTAAGPPGLSAGDRVDVVAAAEPPAARSARLAEDAEVLAVDGDGVTLAVVTAEAAPTAAAALLGPVALVVRP